MIKELEYAIVDGARGASDLHSSEYYLNIFYYNILKAFSIVQVDNSILVQYDDVEHVDEVNIVCVFGRGFLITIHYNLTVYSSLEVTNHEIPIELVNRWKVDTIRELRCTTFIFN